MKSAVRRRMSLIAGSRPGIGVTLIATAVTSSHLGMGPRIMAHRRPRDEWPTGGRPTDQAPAGHGGLVEVQFAAIASPGRTGQGGAGEVSRIRR